MIDGKPACYYLDEAMTIKHDDGTHHFYPAIIVENEPGYNRTDYDYGTDYDIARKTVDSLNAEGGVDRAEVLRIVESSMRASRAIGML